MQPRQCFDGYTYLKILGTGIETDVYQVCKESECDYALKLVEENEWRYALKFGELGVAPTVLDSWYCQQQDRYAIIVPKLDGAVGMLYPFSSTVCSIILSQMFELLYETVYTYSTDHGDTHLGNWLYSTSRDKASYTILLSDWSHASDIQDDRKDVVFRYSLGVLYRSYLYPDTEAFPQAQGWNLAGIEGRDAAAVQRNLVARLDWEVCWLSLATSDSYSAILHPEGDQQAVDRLDVLRQALGRAQQGDTEGWQQYLG